MDVIEAHDVDTNLPVEVEVEEGSFEYRVNALMERIAEDSSVRDRMMCELYIFISDFDTFTRTMAANGGPMQMLKAMMGKG